MPITDTRFNNYDHIPKGGFVDAVVDQGGPPKMLVQPPSGVEVAGNDIGGTLKNWGDVFREKGLSSPNRRIGTASILGGLGAGVYGAMRNPGSRISGALKWGLGGSLLGLLGSGIWEHNLGKQSSYLDPTGSILQSLQNDPSLSFSEKADLLRLVRQLGLSDKSRLSSLLQSFAGGAAGLVVARFLGAKGLLGMGLGAAAGAYLATPGETTRKNIYGQPMLSYF